jgi:hypothetical protein
MLALYNKASTVQHQQPTQTNPPLPFLHSHGHMVVCTPDPLACSQGFTPAMLLGSTLSEQALEGFTLHAQHMHIRDTTKKRGSCYATQGSHLHE